MISVSDLEKSFGDRTLFSGVSFQLNPGERYGLVGANGSGKTTLLRILSGDLEPSEGTVSLPKRLRLGVLRQDHYLYEDHEILGVTLMGNPELWDAMVQKEKLLANAEHDFDADRFSELEETIQRHDGYTAESRASTILEGLGLPGSLHHDPLSTLSGGFKLRVLLAQVLASVPDVLLLDEPTNHLDILSIRWLETFLCDFTGPVVVISHDHRFLDNVSTTILDVDYETVLSYPGNYSAFLEAKLAERERRMKEIGSRKKEIEHHQKFVDRFRAKASKARQAQSKLRMIEKKAEALVELPASSRRYPTFLFEQTRDSGRDVLKVKGIKKAFAENEVLHCVDLLVRRGDRLAIMGPNGIGKSTLLKIVTGGLEADEGAVEWGYETHVGYFAQDHREQLDGQDVTAEEWIWGFCPDRDIGYVRGRMALMLFSGDEAKKRLKTLSGGEAARLIFSKLMLQKPNVLVLDEPTNHLDLESIEALVKGLKAFAGTLILVSHDRWFVGQLATRVVEILRDDIRDYHGTYAEYVHSCGDDHLDVDQVILKAKKERRRAKERDAKSTLERPDQTAQNGDPRKRKKQLQEWHDKLTTRVTSAEARIEEIDGLFCQPGYYDRTSSDEVRAMEAERKGLQDKLTELMAEWEQTTEALGNLE
jgi:ATPase subunit of ABC transporter with duplicated ATPase domains